MSNSNLRRRTTQADSGGDVSEDRSKKDMASGDGNHSEDSKLLSDSGSRASKSNSLLRGSHWLTRIVIIRYVGFIYFVAFLVSLFQNRELLGKDGLLPANLHLANLKQRLQQQSGTPASTWTLMSAAPTVLWLLDYTHHTDYWLDVIAWSGLAISSFMMITGAGNWPLLLTQWMLYHSIVNVGQTWFSFGWESQLLETGFLTVFLTPMLSLSPVPRGSPPSKIVLFAYRWLIFRIMMGAGLIKIRGDKCWRDLTCMNYHYETQPVPNPLSYYMHQSPEVFHKLEVLTNHVVELLAPVLLLLTRRWCMLGGAVQIGFQCILIISGNLSFLNWLTITPSLACFDDASLSWMFSSKPGSVMSRVVAQRLEEETKGGKSTLSSTVRTVFNISLGGLIAYLSVPVVQNLLSPTQAMNTSFDPLRLVNTYGAFGSITKKRTEVILQGTSHTDPSSPLAVWEEYEFHCKPGSVSRRPCLISPYHYRLDWLAWFAAFQSYQHNPWLLHLVAKLLTNDNITDSLIDHNPFLDREPPRFIRAEHYTYKFTKMFSPEAKSGSWWRRKVKGQYLPPVSLGMLKGVMKNMGWPQPRRSQRKKGS